jgi:GH25 family lysozyme M1 (1,4-beta-N-acetylmuramidase)
MLNGYDISNNQGDINNGIVPGNFVWIKATEGVGYTDPDCDANYQQSKAAGKLPAVYHYARPDGNTPEQEAIWFVGQIQNYLGEAVLGLDSETEPVTADWIKRFSDKVYELTKVRVVEYLDQDRLSRIDFSSVWPDYPVWVASYGANNPQNGYGDPNAPVTIPGNWNIFAVQYTSRGKLPGWGGDLDLDIAYVDAAGWKRQAAGDRNAPAPQPVPAPVVPEPVIVPTPEPTPAPEPPVVATPAPVVAPTTVIPVTDTPTPSQSIPVTNTFDPPTTPNGTLFTIKRLNLFQLIFNALKKLFRIK